MPARKRYPTPSEQLLDLAREARAEGLSFEEFWDRAVPPPEPMLHKRSGKPLLDQEGNQKTKPSRVLPRVGDEACGAVLWPNDTRERRDAYEAAVACREGWRRAYENVPPARREKALAILSPLLFPEEEDDDSDEESRGSISGAVVPLPA